MKPISNASSSFEPMTSSGCSPNSSHKLVFIDFRPLLILSCQILSWQILSWLPLTAPIFYLIWLLRPWLFLFRHHFVPLGGCFYRPVEICYKLYHVVFRLAVAHWGIRTLYAGCWSAIPVGKSFFRGLVASELQLQGMRYLWHMLDYDMRRNSGFETALPNRVGKMSRVTYATLTTVTITWQYWLDITC